MRKITGSTAADPGDVPARPPATPAKVAPAPLKDVGPPSPPTPPARSGGGGGSDGSSGRKFSPTTVTLLALVFGFVAVVAQLIYWSNSTDRDHSYNNTDAGKVDLAGRNKVMELRAQTDLVRAQTELAQATGTVPTLVQPLVVPERNTVQPAASSSPVDAQFLAVRKQEMIDRCGRRTEEMVYKPDPGCFYFDNSSGASEKSVGVWSRTRIHVIKPDDDTKQSVIITAADGSTCESGAADSCRTWIQEHQMKDADGFRKLTVRVPKGQGFIANININ
jgi:hypothetical protein